MIQRKYQRRCGKGAHLQDVLAALVIRQERQISHKKSVDGKKLLGACSDKPHESRKAIKGEEFIGGVVETIYFTKGADELFTKVVEEIAASSPFSRFKPATKSDTLSELESDAPYERYQDSTVKKWLSDHLQSKEGPSGERRSQILEMDIEGKKLGAINLISSKKRNYLIAYKEGEREPAITCPKAALRSGALWSSYGVRDIARELTRSAARGVRR